MEAGHSHELQPGKPPHAHPPLDVAVGGGPGAFYTTRWSVILRASQDDPAQAAAALEHLCRTYWYPVYAFVRRRGYSPHDAEDLTQEFFFHLLRRNAFATACRGRGRFRSFLLASLEHFLHDQWDQSRALKRGRDRVVPLDVALAENRLANEPADHQTPEKCYDRIWAMTLLESVFESLQQTYAAEGRQALFDTLKFCLTGERNQMPYHELAAQLGMSEGAVKVAVHRLREQYRRRLRDEIAQTVADESEAEAEYRELLAALAGK